MKTMKTMKKPMYSIQGKDGRTVEVDRRTYMKVIRQMMMKKYG